jgi:hypothetical protein
MIENREYNNDLINLPTQLPMPDNNRYKNKDQFAMQEVWKAAQ